MRRTDPDAALLSYEGKKLPAASETVIAALQPCVTEARFQRLHQVAANRIRSVIPVLEAVADPHNVSACLRSAEAFGIAEMHLVELDKPFFSSSGVARGSARWINKVKHLQSEACVRYLHENHYKVFVASMSGSHRLEDLRAVPKVAVVFGNEHGGASEAMLALADGTFQIPMRGMVESLNVSVACATTLYALTHHRQPDLTAYEVQDLLAHWLCQDVHNAAQIVSDYRKKSLS